MHKNTGWLNLWPGFHVTDSRISHDSAWLRLEPLSKLPLRCGQCLGLVESVHERVTRNVRELSLAGRPLTLQVQLLRVNCTRCGHCLQHVRWRLLNSSHSLAQLADEIGVSDASHLGKLFRQRFGLAPGTFRRQSRGL